MSLYGKQAAKINRINNKGEVIPKLCPSCGSNVGLFFKGEPVWQCSNNSCQKFFGVLPFKK